jgi:hypothetical protein
MTPEQQAAQRGRDKIAAARKEELAREVPTLTLMLPPNAPPGTRVLRDGVELSAPSLGIALPVDPGEHTVETQAPGGPPTGTRITLRRGEALRLELKVRPKPEAAAAPPVAPPAAAAPVAAPAARPAAASRRPVPGPSPEPAPEEEDRGGGRRVAGYIVGGLGVAGIVAGGITGGLVLARKQTVDDHCDSSGAVRECDREGLDAAEQAQTLGLVSTIAFGAGAAGLAAGVVLILTAPSSTDHARKGPQLTAQVSERGGVLVNLQGVW